VPCLNLPAYLPFTYLHLPASLPLLGPTGAAAHSAYCARTSHKHTHKSALSDTLRALCPGHRACNKLKQYRRDASAFQPRVRACPIRSATRDQHSIHSKCSQSIWSRQLQLRHLIAPPCIYILLTDAVQPLCSSSVFLLYLSLPFSLRASVCPCLLHHLYNDNVLHLIATDTLLYSTSCPLNRPESIHNATGCQSHQKTRKSPPLQSLQIATILVAHSTTNLISTSHLSIQ